MPHTLSHLDVVLRCELMTLDRDSFAIVSEPITDSRFLSETLVVDQILSGVVGRTGLVSDATCLSIAIVDPTADVEQAANAICTVRYRFQGRSPYAPDVVLVNEWVRDDFVATCLKLSSTQAASVISRKVQALTTCDSAPIQNGNDLAVLLDSSSIQLLEGNRK
jgi:hypothetical protein